MAIRKSDFEPGVPRTFKLPFGDAKKVEGKFGDQYMVAVQEDGQEKDYLYLEKDLIDEMIDLGMHKGATFTFIKRPDPKSTKGRMLWSVYAGDMVPAEEIPAAVSKPAPPSSADSREPSPPADLWPDDAPLPGELPPDYHHHDTPTHSAPAPASAPASPPAASTPPATPVAPSAPQAKPNGQCELVIPGSNGHTGEPIPLATLGLLYARCIQASETAWQGVGHFGPEQIQAGAATLFIEAVKRGVVIDVEVER